MTAVVCAAGIQSMVTATVQGVASNAITVFVHLRITSLTVTPFSFSGTTCNVTLPAGKLWMMGDHRSSSADSRDHLGDPGGGAVALGHLAEHVDDRAGAALEAAVPRGHPHAEHASVRQCLHGLLMQLAVLLTPSGCRKFRPDDRFRRSRDFIGLVNIVQPQFDAIHHIRQAK